MNEYEQAVFVTKGFSYQINVVGCNKHYYGEINYHTKELLLCQEENIHLTKYQLVILNNPKKTSLEKIEVLSGNNKQDAILFSDINKDILENVDYYYPYYEKGFNLYIINLDFENKQDKIKFYYRNGIVDPIEIKINYIESDKNKYYEKIAAKNREELLSKISVNYRTGDSLINVYWQNASASVKKIIFELFLDNDQRIMKDEINANISFKIVQGLAYGKYYFKVTQLDENDNIIVATDLIPFSLVPPYYGNGKNIVCN